MTYATWLSDPAAHRCVLVEAVALVGVTETTHYLSTAGYVTGAADTPANTVYMPGIAGGVSMTEELSFDGSGGGLSYGDIEIHNIAGERDAWLDYVWRNRSIKVYFGDLSWPRASFQLVFDGIIANLDSKSRTALNFIIRDKLEQLNSSVTTNTLGGSTENADKLIPLTFGECCNVEPLLINPATHQYQVHSGAIENIIEVRDNGAPVSVIKSLSQGTFTLSAAPAGTITCSVQGDKPSGVYSNTISKLIQRLATGYGKSSMRFVSGDLDASNLSSFETAHTQYVGVYLSDRENVIDVIRRLAGSVGAQAIITRAGKLALLQVALPASGTPTQITAADMVEGSFHIAQRVPVKAYSKIGYCKNWTVQTEVATGIPENHKALFAQEIRETLRGDTAVATKYKLDETPEIRETLLLSEADAISEGNRELALYKTPRTVYGFEGYAPCLLLELGGSVTITHARFGFAAGKTGIITKLTPDWIKMRVGVEVLI
jgi:hypothetical protein